MAKTTRAMEITTPLGDDVLLFHALHAREELGRLGEYRLELLSAKADIKGDSILGKNVTVKLALPDDSTRYFNGFVTRFAQGGTLGRYVRYHATVRSWLWFLTRTTDCRIFQEMTVPDIVKKVFADHPTADYKLELTGTYRKWVYCVQYRETDYNFVSRLLEHEGIYFYTRHTDGHNTIVLTDSTSKSAPVPGYEKISFIAPEDVVRPELEHIESWDFASDIQPGVYVHDDYDLERPSVELRTRKTLTRSYSPSDYEIYDYPGHYVQKPDGEQYAHVRIDEFGTLFETAEGAGNSKGVEVGSLFTLEDYPREDQNREYLVVGATCNLRFGDYEALPQGSGGTEYRCSFAAMPTSQQFRPRRSTPKPFVQGPQTAVVVGPAGEEIYTDKYGRVKVQFHWDRYGKKDDKSSCWIRVSQPWAGKAWGGVANPRIGQEVIVDFLEGDPDQPIITGRVYNAEQMPPYELPGNQTQTGIKSRSSPEGGAENFNELMFEDKKGSELVYLRAEKDYTNTVEHDEVRWVGHDRWTEVDNDETNHIKNDRTETVDNNETIKIGVNRKEEVGSNETIKIGANRKEDVGANETITIGASRTEKVGADEKIDIGANRTETVGASESITVAASQTVKVGGSRTDTVAGSVTQTIAGSLTQTVTGGIKVTTPGQVLVTAAGGVTFVAPGGTKFVDWQFEKIGGQNAATYGINIEGYILHNETSAIATAQKGVAIEASLVKNAQMSALLSKAAVRLLSTDSATLNKAGVMLQKANITLFT
jgi:type VI secretion system secreted protein VgrG